MALKLQARHTLSYQLREIIDSRGLTPYALGQLAEVDPGVVSRWLTGRRDIRMETADKLASALGVRLTETAASRATAARPSKPARRPARVAGRPALPSAELEPESESESEEDLGQLAEPSVLRNVQVTPDVVDGPADLIIGQPAEPGPLVNLGLVAEDNDSAAEPDDLTKPNISAADIEPENLRKPEIADPAVLTKHDLVTPLDGCGMPTDATVPAPAPNAFLRALLGSPRPG